jgi:DNA-binding NarL/FixJ family response regulator
VLETDKRLYRVVIVDDQPDIRLLLGTRLALEPDISVVGEASNGAEAIQRARETAPDAIVLDLQMPVMDGFTAVPVLRTINPGTRIVLFSGVGDPSDERLEGPAKPDGFVRKGADLRILIEALRKLLAEAPSDIVVADLGRLPLKDAVNAFDGWVGLNLRIREAMVHMPGSARERSRAELDLMALVGIFIGMGDELLRAAHERRQDVRLQVRTRRQIAQAARRALLILDADNAVEFHKRWAYDVVRGADEPLHELRKRLLDELPVG